MHVLGIAMMAFGITVFIGVLIGIWAVGKTDPDIMRAMEDL